jgi:iron-sulfur cluster repair protein YtfE (RIC family)
MIEPTPQGEALFQDLLWVHSLVRHDLQVVRELAARVEHGLDADQLRAELEALETSGPLWHLRVNCLQYCRFVHHHHRLEDIALFPAIRRQNPELGSVVDRLQADHRRVAEILERIETAAAGLTEDDTPETRRRVADGLGELAEHLLAHLDFEEESVGPALRGWSD